MEKFLYSAEHRLKQHRTRNPLLIFRNDGGSARVAKTIALKTYSSGPRGGMEGALAMARHYELDSLLSIDVGGTTTDVGAVSRGILEEEHYGVVEGVNVSAPLCRIRSEGVGGSSVIRTADKNIEVGPQSVGAAPGPACFARGGTELTITDVLLLTGLIDPATYFGGALALDKGRAENALSEKVMKPLMLDQDAALAAVEAAWLSKIVACVKPLVDLNAKTMIAGFGGGGPMLLTAVADALNLKQAIIPGMAAIFSAYGIGFSDLSQHYQTQVSELSKAALDTARESLIQRAARDMFAENTALKDCHLQFSLVNLEDGSSVSDWGDDDAIPAGFKGAALLRLEATKPIERLSFRKESTKEKNPIQAGSTRALLDSGEHIEVALYQFKDIQPGDSAAGPCVVEDEYFTARIDRGWQFLMSGNRDLLLTRGDR